MTTLARRLAALAVLAFAVMFAPLAEAQGRRLALVVGNAHYQNLPELATPGEDASRMAEALRRLGFEVTLLSDVSDTMFRAMLDVVSQQAQGAEAVVFYYAGHAFQVQGENYLLPVDAQADPAAATTWSMTDILRRLQGTGATTLVFLDACRNNPLGAAVGGDGLAPMDGETGTFIAFATRPGQVSFDRGSGAVSPFAQALLDHIETPGLGISDLMIRVRRDVEAATVGRQVPWDQSSLRSAFVFADGPAPAPVAASGGLDIFGEATAVAVASADPAPAPVVRAAPDPVPAPAPVAVAPAPAPVPAPASAPALKTATLAHLAGTALPPAVAPADRPATGAPERLAALAPVAPGAAAPADRAVLATVAPAERPRILGMAPQVEGAAFTPQSDPTAPAPAGNPAATAAILGPVPQDLPRAVQEELKRIGCYGMTVDGDWGGGSRTALTRYYEEKKQTPVEPLDPTEALWRVLAAEPAGVCKQAVAVAPKPAAPAKPAAAKTTTKKKATTEKPKAAAKPAAKPAPAPAKKKPTCKFMVVAIVCS